MVKQTERMPFMFIKQQPSHLATLLFYYLYPEGQFTVAALLLYLTPTIWLYCDTAHAHILSRHCSHYVQTEGKQELFNFYDRFVITKVTRDIRSY